jgi:hypothetical protein
MTGHRTRLRVVVSGAALAMATALTACDSGAPPAQGQDTSGQSGAGAGLLSVAQAELAARQWWSQNEQALVRRDGPALDRLDAAPLANVVGHAAAVSAAIGRTLLASPRDPSAVRVYVPAEQSYPLRVLAVFDVAVTGKTATVDHVAEMFVQGSASASFVAEQSVLLDGPEPRFDADANGLVHTIDARDQTTRLGRRAAQLPAQFDAYMDGVAHGQPPPGAPAFAPGKHTSVVADADATYLRTAATRSNGSISTVDLGYLAVDVSAPVFAVAGGGGFTMFAVQRTETLHPASGQAFVQDAARHNWGADLAPGQYPQITLQSVVLVAALMPAGGGPVEALGTGGGTIAEG